MKATGVTRRLDNMGRIVIPKELRTVHDIDIGDPVEFFTEGNDIIIRKYELGCIFCGFIMPNVINFKGKEICEDCREALRNGVE